MRNDLAELNALYHSARNHHRDRRDKALARARRLITRPGWCSVSVDIEKMREWFDGWEKHLWETYRDAKYRVVSRSDGEGDPCRPSGREDIV